MNQPPQPPQPPPYQQAALPGCWWHPNRQTGLRCTRCDRPACPDCLREASVGYQCIDCVQAGQRAHQSRQTQYRRAGFGARTVAGARVAERPIVVPVLIAINVIVYVITAMQAGSPMDNGSSALHQDGVLWPIGITFMDEWWRLFTSGFLHYGLIHIAMNMIAMWVLGRDLELLLGKARFLAVYLVSLLGGSAAVFLFDDIQRGTAGASGAIYGIMGGIAVAVFRLRLNPTGALGVIVLNIVISFSLPNISWLGHLGGLAIGVLATAAMVYAPAKGRVAWQAGTLVLLTVALLGLVVYRDNEIAQQVCQIYGHELVCADVGT